jgi:hypothetical protein
MTRQERLEARRKKLEQRSGSLVRPTAAMARTIQSNTSPAQRKGCGCSRSKG